MTYKYATQTEGVSKAVGTDLPLSYKTGSEICRAIRGKKVERAKKILQDAIEMKKAIPYTRYNDDVGHKTKIGPGRFPIKASQQILGVIDSAIANARFKGITTENLIVKNILAQAGAETFKHGRQTRRRAKRTHIEVVLAEGKEEKKKTTKKEKTKVKEEKKEIVEKPKTKPTVEEKKEIEKEQPKEVVKEEKKEVVEEPKKEVQKTQDKKESPKETEDKKE